jgi:hypothetical protein
MKSPIRCPKADTDGKDDPAVPANQVLCIAIAVPFAYEASRRLETPDDVALQALN